MTMSIPSSVAKLHSLQRREGIVYTNRTVHYIVRKVYHDFSSFATYSKQYRFFCQKHYALPWGSDKANEWSLWQLTALHKVCVVGLPCMIQEDVWTAIYSLILNSCLTGTQTAPSCPNNAIFVNCKPAHKSTDLVLCYLMFVMVNKFTKFFMFQ
jgi:hypothetical protein